MNARSQEAADTPGALSGSRADGFLVLCWLAVVAGVACWALGVGISGCSCSSWRSPSSSLSYVLVAPGQAMLLTVS